MQNDFSLPSLFYYTKSLSHAGNKKTTFPGVPHQGGGERIHDEVAMLTHASATYGRQVELSAPIVPLSSAEPLCTYLVQFLGHRMNIAHYITRFH